MVILNLDVNREIRVWWFDLRTINELQPMLYKTFSVENESYLLAIRLINRLRTGMLFFSFLGFVLFRFSVLLLKWHKPFLQLPSPVVKHQSCLIMKKIYAYYLLEEKNFGRFPVVSLVVASETALRLDCPLLLLPLSRLPWWAQHYYLEPGV